MRKDAYKGKVCTNWSRYLPHCTRATLIIERRLIVDELDISRDRSPSFVDANERAKDRTSSFDTNERANKLSERMRDLYDFKTENEWPKKAGTSRENTWISKSSSEEDRSNYPPVRRNSQDLEFNDRIDIFKVSVLRSFKIGVKIWCLGESIHPFYLYLPQSKQEEVPSRIVQQEEERRRPKCSIHNVSEVFADELDIRLRKFNDRLRYSEDFSARKVRGRERRTYSDDYDEKVRRQSRSRQPEPMTFKRDRPEVPAIRRLVDKENKRNSDPSLRPRGSQISYVDIDFTKRDSRTSNTSYASVNLSKMGSVECKSTSKILDVPPRRAFSQSDERPATPVPPIEFNDERYVPKKLSERDSTRYKVYLT